MRDVSNQIRKWEQHRDGASLGAFRIVTGVIFFSYFLSSIRADRVRYFFVAPKFHFKYIGFEWVHPLPGEGMVTLYWTMCFVSVFVALGAFYRVSALLLAVGYTYIFLLDKAHYQNHYYLMMLTGWVMVVLPANRWLAIDQLLRKKTVSTVPVWSIWLARFQVGLPYFFGGIAKLNWDWVNGQPMRMKLANSTWYPFVGSYFTEEWCVQIFVWGGVVFDLMIVPALLWKPTRVPAYLAALSFHLMNATLFNIGVFPWFMIFATTIYFEPSWPRLWKSRLTPVRSHTPNSQTSPSLLRLLCVYLCLQVLLPWRHLFYSGNVSWTEEGHFFAWHMKLRDKKTVCKFKWRNPKMGTSGELNVFAHLTREQAAHASGDPEMIVQLCRYFRSHLQHAGYGDCEVYTLAYTSLNGRKPQLLINPALDLGRIPRSVFLPREVFTECAEPLRPLDPWNIPRPEWLNHLSVPDREFWFGKSVELLKAPETTHFFYHSLQHHVGSVNSHA